MVILWWHIALYGLLSVSIAVLIVLKLNPKVVQGFIRRLMLDPEFVREATHLSQAFLIREIINEVVPVVVEGVAGCLGNLRVELPDGLHKTIIDSMNSWMGTQAKAAAQIEGQVQSDIRDYAQYANMNQGNPQVMEVLKQRIAAKNPTLGMLLTVLDPNNGPPTRGRGGMGGY